MDKVNSAAGQGVLGCIGRIGRTCLPKGMLRSKKGVIFILIAMLVIGFLVILFANLITIRLDEGVAATKARVYAMDRFASKFPSQVLSAVRSQSQHALNELSLEMFQNGAYVADLEKEFMACLMNGTAVVGFHQPCGNMENKTLPKTIDRIVSLTQDEMNVNVTYNISAVSIFQAYPFEVTVSLNLSYIVADSTASWNRSVQLSVPVDITGIVDPYYAVGLGTMNYTIRQTSVAVWNRTTLQGFLEGKEYRYDKNGTAFLARYTHSIEPNDCCGIEALVVPDIFNKTNRSAVDRKLIEDMVFDCSNESTMIFRIAGMSPDFRLDISSVVAYGVYNESLALC